jgi:superfamily II DNA or RNA helicase
MNKIKGDNYEIYIRNYIINELNKEAYLWKDIPEKILIDAKLIHSHNQNRIKRKNLLENPLIDVGVDILQIDDNKNYTMIQCKNGYSKGLRIEDLAGFYMMMFNHYNNNGIVYYTSKLSIHITENAINPKIQYIKLPMNNIEEKNKIFKPYDYQIEASQKIITYLKENDKAILSMPCGCGKTLTSYLIAEKYNKIIIFSPLKQFAKQNMDKFIEYSQLFLATASLDNRHQQCYKNKSILVDSDGSRDINEIKKFINNNLNYLISTTYKSVDIIVELNLENCLIIIDEFHNLSKNNITNEYDDFYKLLNSNNKLLFISATPRIYELEDDDNNFFEFGEIVYNMPFNEAIKNKYICDYKIWLPSIHEDNTELISDIGMQDINDELRAKCMFLFKCLLYNSSRKCIIYCQDTKDLNNIKDTIVKMNEYYLLDLNIQEITSETSYKNREKILNYFESSDKIELLLSIRILDECIDIPLCDAIYITYPSKSKIRTIQRLCRCIRIDKNNKFKIGNIYIWCNEYNLILETLSGIKEYDTLFKEKINVLETNWTGKKEIDIKVVKDKKLIEKYILDIKEFRQYSWDEKLDMVIKYIVENGKKPSISDKDNNIKQLSCWISYNNKNYKNKKEFMKNEKIYNKWTQFIKDYQNYLLSNEEFWYQKFDQLKIYIKENNNLPSRNNKNNNIKHLTNWFQDQKKKYKNKKESMKNEKIYNSWTQFIEEYQNYLLSNEKLWYQKFDQLKIYIKENNKLPSRSNKDNRIKQLCSWLNNQKNYYKYIIKSMKNKEIYNNWTRFTEEYKEYLLSNEELWYQKFDQLKIYIKENNKLPSRCNKDNNIKKLEGWLYKQKKNYNTKTQSMKNDEIYNKWTQFIKEYKKIDL